jgi:hypothetical protein
VAIFDGKVNKMSRLPRVSKARFEAAIQASKPLTRAADRQVGHLTLQKPENEAAMWKAKRARQAADIGKLVRGEAAQSDMLLFTEAQARGAKILNGPY